MRVLYLVAFLPFVMSYIDFKLGSQCVDASIEPPCSVVVEKNWCRYMKEDCCESCKHVEIPEDPNCKDVWEDCVVNGIINGKERNPDYYCTTYPDKCRKTCGLCQDTTLSNLWNF